MNEKCNGDTAYSVEADAIDQTPVLKVRAVKTMTRRTKAKAEMVCRI